MSNHYDHDNRMIGPMAAFIGARLQYPCPEVNGQGNPWVSTIRVDQHKEKFFYIRVYCDLAAEELVQRYFTYLKDREKKRDAGEKFYSHIRQTVIDMVKLDSPSEEFFQRCVKHDAIHYRKCHLEMVALQPHLMGKICSQADHTELLFPQVDEALSELTDRMNKSEDWKNSYLKKYHVGSVDELADLIRIVYNPSMKDVMELRD